MPNVVSLTVNLETGDFYFTLPADFDYTDGPALELVDRLIVSVTLADA